MLSQGNPTSSSWRQSIQSYSRCALRAPCQDLSSQFYLLTFASLPSNSLISPLSSSTVKNSIDFRDPAALRTLTEVLLKHDFQLHVPLREDRLCPPVPNRLNYVLWLQDLLAEQGRVLNAIESLEFELLRDKHKLLGKSQQEPSSKRRKYSHLTEADAQGQTPERETNSLLGLDIGTGASLIYPLLCCSFHPTATPSRLAPPPTPLERAEWHMIGTDIDLESVKHARSLLSDADLTEGKRRGLNEKISVVFRDEKQRGRLIPTLQELRDDEACRKVLQRAHRSPGSSLRSEDEDQKDLFDFTMCNPPFYASAQAMQTSAKLKVLPANAACTGTYGEMIYDGGGEVGFVGQMIEESLAIRNPNASHQIARASRRARRTWYTSMLGLKASVETLVHKLKANNFNNWLVTELLQGETRRWVLAWTFSSIRVHIPADVSASKRLSYLQPPAVDREAIFHWTVSTLRSMDETHKEALEQAARFIESVPGATWQRTAVSEKEQETSAETSWLLGMRQVSWNRAARRKRARVDVQPENGIKNGNATEDWLLVVRLTLCRGSDTETGVDASVRLDARWLYGSNESHFQSFCSHAARTLQSSRIADAQGVE